MIGICKNCSKTSWKFSLIDGRNIFSTVLIASSKAHLPLDPREDRNVLEVTTRLDHPRFAGFSSGFANENSQRTDDWRCYTLPFNKMLRRAEEQLLGFFCRKLYLRAHTLHPISLSQYSTTWQRTVNIGSTRPILLQRKKVVEDCDRSLTVKLLEKHDFARNKQQIMYTQSLPSLAPGNRKLVSQRIILLHCLHVGIFYADLVEMS